MTWWRKEPKWVQVWGPEEPQPEPELSADERNAWERAENNRK